MQPNLLPYMLEFRKACTEGARLSEEAFEQINMLPAGTMASLKPYCTVQEGLASGDVLRNGPLYLVLRGAVANVEEFDPQSESATTLPIFRLSVSVKGYHGRGMKRLRKRYTPGSIVGKSGFYLRLANRLVRQSDPFGRNIVSSKFGRDTEVWAISPQQWEQLPSSLQRALHDVMLLQNAEERQHTSLSGE